MNLNQMLILVFFPPTEPSTSKTLTTNVFKLSLFRTKQVILFISYPNDQFCWFVEQIMAHHHKSWKFPPCSYKFLLPEIHFCLQFGVCIRQLYISTSKFCDLKFNTDK